MADSDAFVQRLQYVLQFLTENGFEKAATAVCEQLDKADDPLEGPSQGIPDYADELDPSCQATELRSRSADAVLQDGQEASQPVDAVDDVQPSGPWPIGAAEALLTRLSGSSRLYEEPDVDEYGSMDDLGYVRRSITNQQHFIINQLDFLRTNDDESYFNSSCLPHGASSSSLQHADSCSNSSSASLSSPGLSSCTPNHDVTSTPQHDAHQLSSHDIGLVSSAAGGTGDASWDSGPADITFAEPVTTPTQESQRSSISDLKPSLSRVESLSNSFIEECESVEEGAAGTSRHSGRDSEAGSISGDLSTPQRHSGLEDSSGNTEAGAAQQVDAASNVIDLSPASPPPECAADAGFDLSNIFELGLRASSRTSSVDVLHGSIRCWSEADSDIVFGQQQPLDTGRVWVSTSASSSVTGSNASSRATPASLSGPTGPLVVKPRQSIGASRLQTSSQHGPEDVQQQQQQEVAAPEPQPAELPQKQEQQQHGEVQQQEEAVVRASLQQASPTQQLKQQDQNQEIDLQQQSKQQRQHSATESDSGSSAAVAPVTPTSPASGAPLSSATDAAAAVAVAASPCDRAAAGADDLAASSVPAAPLAAPTPDEVQQQEVGSPASPPAAAGGGGGFGFSFPTTPPSAVDAAVHEERAERVFSTWASNHSRSLSGALDLEDADAEADSNSSKPTEQGAADSTTSCRIGQWSAADGCADTGELTAGAGLAESADACGVMQCDAAQVTLAMPVIPSESPFFNSAVLAACSKSSSPAGNSLSRGGSRAHSSSSAAMRAAAAGGSSRGSSRRLSAAGKQQQQQQKSMSAASSGGLRSPLGDEVEKGDLVGAQSAAHLLQQSSAGYDPQGAALLSALDADAESTGGYSGSGELAAPRYIIDESGNPLYEYDTAYIDNRYEMFDLRIIHRRRRTGFEDSKEFPIRKNDLIAGRYQVMDFLGSAAFSQAVQALDVATGALVCLKIIKNNKDYFDQSLDEIKLLRYVNNADPDDEHHIVRLYDFFYYKEHLILVCELLRANLYEFQKYQRENGDDPYFTPPRIQRIALQVLQSLAFLHSLGLVHSDLKPENILIKSYSRCEVKVIDLGSSCFITDHLSSYVQSRSYRAPEVILGLPYGQKVDIWSLGCILAELATGYVLFQNDSLATLLARLEGILGPLPSWMVAQGRYSNRYFTRSRQLYERSKATGRYELLLPKQTSLRHRVPTADEGFLDFLSYLLTPDPSARPSATEALQHPWLAYPYPPVEQVPD